MFQVVNKTVAVVQVIVYALPGIYLGVISVHLASRRLKLSLFGVTLSFVSRI